MSEYVVGKHYDHCLLCGESKLAIRKSQKKSDPIYCAVVESNESGSEVSAEYDRHMFAMTQKLKNDEDTSKL